MTGGELAQARILVAEVQRGVDYGNPQRARRQIGSLVMHLKRNFHLSPGVAARIRTQLYLPLGEPAP